eukprot:546106-Pelagomonas_calceolata.AAC.1
MGGMCAHEFAFVVWGKGLEQEKPPAAAVIKWAPEFRLADTCRMPTGKAVDPTKADRDNRRGRV